MSMRTISICAGTVAALLGSAALAQDASDAPYVSPCSQAPYTDFDFWVQDWVAFHSDTGVVMGIDDVHKINGGCIIAQEWIQLSDDFRAEGSEERYAGMSFSSVLGDGRWQQIWVGHDGGTLRMTGGLDDNGTMVMTTGAQVSSAGYTYQRTWYWDPQDDGSVHSWGEMTIQEPDGSWGDLVTTWDLRYVSRHAVGDLIEAPAE